MIKQNKVLCVIEQYFNILVVIVVSDTSFQIL